MTLSGFITERGSIQRILEHIREPTRLPPIASARGPPHGEVDFDRREVDAFASSDPSPSMGSTGELVGTASHPLFLPVAAPRPAQAHVASRHRLPTPAPHPAHRDRLN